MPKFTIEATYDLPVYRHRTYEAATAEEALKLALEDDDWEGQKSDIESSGPTRLTGAWEGDAAYIGALIPYPTTDPLRACLDALRAVMRCANGEIERPATQRQPWGEAQRLIETAFKACGVSYDPETMPKPAPLHPGVVAVLRTSRDLLTEAIETHIYADDDEIPADCAYTAGIKDLDAILAAFSANISDGDHILVGALGEIAARCPAEEPEIEEYNGTEDAESNGGAMAYWETGQIAAKALAAYRGEAYVAPVNKYETAARAAGWVSGGDNGDVIYDSKAFGSWKEAVSWAGGGDDDESEGAVDSPIYSTWRECCDGQNIVVGA